MAYVERGFVCDGCDSFFESKWDAKDCCRPEVFAAYMCGDCGAWYDTKENAKKCCPDEIEPNEHETDCAA